MHHAPMNVFAFTEVTEQFVYLPGLQNEVQWVNCVLGVCSG